MSAKSKVFQNTIWQIIGRVLMVAASTLSVSILTRRLGAAGYGDFVLITGLTLLFFNLADLGTGTTAVKTITRQPDKANSIFNRTLTLKLILTFVAGSIFILAGLFLHQLRTLQPLIAIAALALFFLNLRAGGNIFFIAHSRLLLKVIFEVTASLLFVFSLLLIPQLNLTVTIIAWVTAAAVSGLSAFIYLIRTHSLTPRLTDQNLPRLLQKALPIGLHQLIFATYDFAVDSFFIKTFLTSQAVGYYGLAYKIHTNLILVAAFFMNSLFPTLIANKTEQIRRPLRFATKILLPAALLIALLLQLTAPFIITILAGPAFNPAINILKILGIALIFAYLNHILGYTLIARNFSRQLLYFSLVSLGVNLVGNYYLIPHWGIRGAAWVTVITEAVTFLLSWQFIRRHPFKKT